MTAHVYDYLLYFEEVSRKKKLKACHYGLYFYLLCSCNRKRWAEWFELPRIIAMTKLDITENTWYKYVKLLEEAELLIYERVPVTEARKRNPRVSLQTPEFKAWKKSRVKEASINNADTGIKNYG
jgi:hypothetical protein